MNFHIVQRNARHAVEEAMETIRSNGGDKLMVASALRAHCRAANPANADPALHAALCFLQSADIGEAFKRYYRETGSTNPIVAELQFMQSINLARTTFQEDDEGLYAKGLLATPSGRYYRTPKGLEKGSLFDEARQQIDPRCAVILFHATGWALGHKSGSRNKEIHVGSRTLQYIAVQLMPEGAEKDIKIDRLSRDMNPKRHFDHMTQAARAIKLISAEQGIVFTNDMPRIREKFAPVIEGGWKKRMIETERRSAERERDIYGMLRQQVKSGHITREQARIYHDFNGGKHTFNDIARHYSTDPVNVEKIVTRVGKILGMPESPSRDITR